MLESVDLQGNGTRGGEPARRRSAERIVSVDALRGFDMFWIIGAESIVLGLRPLSDSSWIRSAAAQLEHVPWEGFHFYDLIFPLFIFLTGMSIVFSLGKLKTQGGTRVAYARLGRRAILLYLLGLLYYAEWSESWPDKLRFLGVLQRIALTYLAAGILFLHLRRRGLVLVFFGILIGYWLLLSYVPVPGVGEANCAVNTNLANYIDQQFLPGRKAEGSWDPEGLLSTIPAIATALLGVFAGLLLRDTNISKVQRSLLLALLGLIGLAAGAFWGAHFPIIKKIWTSSYVLWAGGWSFLLLCLFYTVIDIWGYQRWARPFVWIGMNSIAIYLLTHFVSFERLFRRAVPGSLSEQLGVYETLGFSLLALGLAIAICFALHKRRIYFRV